MMTRGRVFVLDASKSVSLHCNFTFEQYTFFDNPLVWFKNQLSERTQVRAWEVKKMEALTYYW